MGGQIYGGKQRRPGAGGERRMWAGVGTILGVAATPTGSNTRDQGKPHIASPYLTKRPAEENRRTEIAAQWGFA